MTEKLKQLHKQIVGYFLGALGLVAGLAWNEAVKGLIGYLYPLDDDGLLLKFIYAVVITIIVILVSWILLRDQQE